jgi:signal transduction histidine kinase
VSLSAVLWFAATLAGQASYTPRAALAAAVLSAPAGLPRTRRTRVALAVCVACAVPWLPSTPAAFATAGALAIGRPRSIPAATLAAAVAGTATVRAVLPIADATSLAAYSLGFAAVAVLLVREVAMARRRATELAVQLRRSSDPHVLERALAAAGGDPRLHLEVQAGLRLVAENTALRDELDRQAEELQRSRRRLVEAGQRQRAALQRRVAAGPAATLALLEPQVAGLPVAEGLLVEARRQIDDLGRGLLPAAVARGDLGTALVELAASSPVPVAVRVEVRSLPSTAAATLWFVVGEAVANAAKHSGAQRVAVSLTNSDTCPGIVTVEIVDDGSGGADPSGGGLRGLADRVEALGGILEIASSSAGTTIRATIDTRELR